MSLRPTVDRWGPGAIALVTLLALIGSAWAVGERIARLEGRLDEQRAQSAEAIRSRREAEQQFQAVAKWVIALYERADSAGWQPPQLPDEVMKYEHHQKKAVRPAGDPARGGGRP